MNRRERFPERDGSSAWVKGVLPELRYMRKVLPGHELFPQYGLESLPQLREIPEEIPPCMRQIGFIKHMDCGLPQSFGIYGQ